MTKPQFILASSSTSRRIMLESAGVPFVAVAPSFDEEPVKEKLIHEGADGPSLAHALAEAKCRAVSEDRPGALVLGADQVLVSEGTIYSKAGDEAEARRILRALRGKEHELISAAILMREGVALWRRTDMARLTMRNFSDAFLHDYMAAEMPDILGSVGCYRIEGRGAQLFSSVRGDHFCIRGLPLIPVLEALRDFEGLPS
jgi:septum formation protein